MHNTPSCPKCHSSYVYEDRDLMICPECAYEWLKQDNFAVSDSAADFIVRDANGTILQDGDTITLIKDLKLKNSSDVIKVGTKIKNIRLVDEDHNITCKAPGIGPMGLKSEFVKKVTE